MEATTTTTTFSFSDNEHAISGVSMEFVDYTFASELLVSEIEIVTHQLRNALK